MQKISETKLCKGGKYCHRCRQTSERARLASFMEVDCPKALAIVDDTITASQKPHTPAPVHPTTPCHKCPNNRSCGNVTVCCGGQVNVQIVIPCPRGFW